MSELIMIKFENLKSILVENYHIYHFLINTLRHWFVRPYNIKPKRINNDCNWKWIMVYLLTFLLI